MKIRALLAMSVAGVTGCQDMDSSGFSHQGGSFSGLQFGDAGEN